MTMDQFLNSNERQPAEADAVSHCPFLTNHSLVLLCVANSPEARVRDIAETVGITERATQTILSDLDHHGYLERTRLGRRNHYKVCRIAMLRQPLVDGSTVGD